MNWWLTIVNYYETIGRTYGVDPILFVGIHAVDTPLFAVIVGWIIYRYRKNKPIVLQSFIALIDFNAANIYLIVFGKNLPFWIYAFVITTTLITGYFTLRKIRKKMVVIDEQEPEAEVKI